MRDQDDEDIASLHHAVLRERHEPSEGREPVPLWMWIGFGLLIAWGGWYLGRFDGGFDFHRIDMHPIAGAVTAPEQEVDLGALGQQVYASRCAACHQATGEGLQGLAPPLAGSEWVTGEPQRAIRVVLHGLQGPIEVRGEAWDGVMPGLGGALSDAEVAAVLTWIRGAWGNDAPSVRPELVTEIRAATDRSTPWTAPEL